MTQQTTTNTCSIGTGIAHKVSWSYDEADVKVINSNVKTYKAKVKDEMKVKQIVRNRQLKQKVITSPNANYRIMTIYSQEDKLLGVVRFQAGLLRSFTVKDQSSGLFTSLTSLKERIKT